MSNERRRIERKRKIARVVVEFTGPVTEIPKAINFKFLNSFQIDYNSNQSKHASAIGFPVPLSHLYLKV